MATARTHARRRPFKVRFFPYAAAGRLLTLAAMLTACFPTLPALVDDDLPSPTGSLFVTVQTASIVTETVGFPAPELLRVTLSRPRTTNQYQTLQREVAFDSGRPVSVSFERIETGHWSITAEVLDQDSVPIYAGTGEAYVQDSSTVSINLNAVRGQLEVVIELGADCIQVSGSSDCLADVTDRGRIYLAPTEDGDSWNQNIDWKPGEPIGPVLVSRLAPGDYEFQIVFYAQSRTAGNTLYVGHWVPFRIQPGRTTTVVWQPEVGTLAVEIHIIRPPSAPTDLTATWTDEGVLLQWTGSNESNVTHYNVWHRTGPRVEIGKVHEAPGGLSTAWLDTTVSADQCKTGTDEGLFYVVTAVNNFGLQSFRSNEVDACANR